MKKERIFTQAETEAAERLKKIWESKKRELSLTQEKVAQLCDWGNQSAFGAYLHARVQLNTESVLKLAKVLQVHPTEIMPEIAALLPNNQSINTDNTDVTAQAQAKDGLTDEAMMFARAFQDLPPEQRAVLESTAKAFMDSTKKQGKGRVA